MTQQFWENQAAIKNLYSRCIEPVCCQYHLSRTELDILLFLANNPAYHTASDIVLHRGISKSHVSASLAALERRSWLSRSHLPNDRRTICLTLRDEAGPAVKEGRACQRRFGELLFTGFLPQDLENFNRLMGQLANNAHRAISEKD